MSEAIDLPTQEVLEGAREDAGGLGGHPSGLTTLFFTELWERFSYYGMRAILVLYVVAPAARGGLGFDTKQAASIYGTYTMSVYLTALPGGLIADRWLGARLAVLLGGIVIACGHFTMVFRSTNFLYAGMGLIARGTGLLKPNISAMVGGLYREDEAAADSDRSLTSGDWKRIAAIFVFFLFTILFWAAYEQKGASLNLFAAKLVGIMMGVWFLASSLGSKLAGYLSGFFVADSPATLVRLYGGIAVGLLVATAILAALIPTLRRLMGHVR